MAEIASAIRKFALITTAYTPIIAPICCNYYLIIGNQDGSAMLRSSDGTDANSYEMPAGGWYSMMAPPMILAFQCRFQQGNIVTWLKAVAGVGPAIVEFVW